MDPWELSWNFLEQKLKAASFEGLKRLVIYEYLAAAYGCTWKNTQGSQGLKLALFRTKVKCKRLKQKLRVAPLSQD